MKSRRWRSALRRFVLRALNPVWSVRREPIIVLGNQKSGTTAIAALLARAAGLSSTIDVPPVWNARAAALRRGERSFDRVVRRNRWYFRSELIKEPNFIFFFEQVRDAFPDARYLLVLREPRDNIRSFLDRLRLPGHLEELPAGPLPGGRDRVLFEPSAWGYPPGNYVEVAARRWRTGAEIALQTGGDVEVVKYESFLSDKKGVIEATAKRLDLSVVADVEPFVDVQFQPSGQPRSDYREYFGPNLGAVRSICLPAMSGLGYAW